MHTPEKKKQLNRDFPKSYLIFYQELTIKKFGKQIFQETISPGLHSGYGVVTIIRINRISRTRYFCLFLKTLNMLGNSIPSLCEKDEEQTRWV